ncbi:MAG: F0F1 ATP synthase subunit B' [Thermostichales cyanobacterium BF4_bins_65]
MPIFSWSHSLIVLAAEASEEGSALFDFDATLPVIAIQFLLLAAILNAIYFQPLTKTVDERNEYINLSLAEAKEKLAETERVTQQYLAATSQARLQAQQLIAAAEKEAQGIRAQKLAEVQAEIHQKMAAAKATLEAERQAAFAALEAQVASLSEAITAKLLG